MASSGDEAKEIVSKLSDIWNSRGTISHSRERDAELAREARHLLAEAIHSIMELIRDGELQPAHKNIPEGIQNRILRGALFRAEDGS